MLDKNDMKMLREMMEATVKETVESSGAWKYKGGELTAFAVKFRINGTSETAAGTDINYFFLL